MITNPTPTQPGETLEMPERIWVNPTSLMDDLHREHARIFLERNFKNDIEYVRTAVAGPRGDAAFIQKVATLPCARVDGDECFYFEREVATYCASCHAKYLIETAAATSSPTPAESELLSYDQLVAKGLASAPPESTRGAGEQE